MLNSTDLPEIFVTTDEQETSARPHSPHSDRSYHQANTQSCQCGNGNLSSSNRRSEIITQIYQPRPPVSYSAMDRNGNLQEWDKRPGPSQNFAGINTVAYLSKHRPNLLKIMISSVTGINEDCIRIGSRHQGVKHIETSICQCSTICEMCTVHASLLHFAPCS